MTSDVRQLPTGTVTLLFTDIEGSTRMLQELGREAYVRALTEHRRLLRDAFTGHGGVEVEMQGDSFFFAFPYARDAVAAASAAQQALAAHAWEAEPIKVRIGLHTGEPIQADGLYAGLDVHWAARVMSAGHGGQILLSARTAELVQSEPDLELRDLGQHRLKDLSAPQHLYQAGDGVFPPLKTISNTNLPRPASSFVGRGTEQAEIVELIRQGARLVTLTGPGGAGKTRLAIEAAAMLLPSFGSGVFWVGLASLRDSALVTETIALTIGAKDDLATEIAERQLLLVLDNFEQVVEAAPELSGLLRACPQLTLLVTSRELLRVDGEIEYGVPPLPEPEGVALFCKRSRLRPSGEIRELCRRLDSLPLALELAAARTRALAPAEILGRLSQRLDFLKGGRDADPRQQTLRATIDWSYDLLSEKQQRTFTGLSVFVGGCTLDAAEAVVEANPDTLQSLVEKSLIRFSKRYWLLETIREYGAEQLVLTGQAEELRRRHATYFLGLAEDLALAVEAYEGTVTPHYEIAVAEHDNMRGAIAWSVDADVELGLRLAVALEQFWVARNPFEGVRTLTSLLEAGADIEPRLLARALRCLGGCLTISGEAERAKPVYERSLAIYRRLDDEWGVVHMRHRLVTTALAAGDTSFARPTLEENLLRAKALDSRYLEGEALSVLGVLAGREARWEEAVDLLRRSRDIARAVGFRWREAIDLGNLAEASLALARPHEAQGYARDAVALSREMDDRLTTVASLAMLARTARALGEDARAGRLWGAIEAEEARAPLGRWDRYRDEFAAAVLEPTSTEFERGRSEGRAQSLPDAVEHALIPN